MMIGTIALLVLAQASPAEITRVQVNGTFVEPLSRLTFPHKVAGWARTDVLKYPAPPRSNYSVAFELRQPGGPVKARAVCYVYSQEPPIPAELDTHFRTSLDEIAALRTDFELVRSSPMRFGTPGRELDARWAMFLLRQGLGDYHEPVVSQLFVLKHDAYWVKWRITSPATGRGDISEQVLALVESLVPGA